MGRRSRDRLSRGAMLLSLIAIGASLSFLWPLQSRASAYSITAFSGECAVSVRARLNPAASKVTLSTPQPGTCVTTLGGGTVTVDGSAGPKVVQPGFTCVGGVGVGGVTLEFTTPMHSATVENARLDLVNAGGIVAMAANRDMVTVPFAAAGSLTQSPSVVDMCTLGITEATWTGTIAFEHLSQEGAIRLVHGHCLLTVEAVRTGDELGVRTAQPMACATNWGDGILAFDGTAGPSGVLLGFDCLGGAGTGGAIFDVVTPFAGVHSTDMSLDVAADGAAMTIAAAEDTAAQYIAWGASFVEQPGADPTCPIDDAATGWTGVLVFAAVQVS